VSLGRVLKPESPAIRTATCTGPRVQTLFDLRLSNHHTKRVAWRPRATATAEGYTESIGVAYGCPTLRAACARLV
jgi:hypothetical protein